MRALSLICLICLSIWGSDFAFSQISYPGLPVSYKQVDLSELKQSSALVLPAIDVQALMKEDLVTDGHKDIPWRFGEVVDVDLSPGNSGQWDQLEGGNKIWRLKITSQGALSLNFNFDTYLLPQGATLHIYDPARTQLLGAFTSANNKADSSFATFIIRGETAIIEYYEPAEAATKGLIKIGSVVHGYRQLGKAATGFGNSGLCNIGINCPEAASWQMEKRSVVMIMLANNSRVCTGVLLNNARQDGRPFVLTANHCPINTNNIFAFNYDSPDCIPPSNPSTNQTVSGCFLRASNSSTTASDFNLVELSNKPPGSYNAFYAGWSNLDQPSEASVCIHHPKGDVKKISFDYQQVQSSGYYALGNNHWMVLEWDTGTTEDASSGSPLFNEQHRVVGQLHGGDASCATDTFDIFGKFSFSWNTEADTTKQLKYWLDPDNSGINVLDGFDPNGVTVSLDAQLAGLKNFENIICDDTLYPAVTIKNRGSSVLTFARIIYMLDKKKDSVEWTGSLNTDQLAVVNLPPIPLSTGKHRFVAVCTLPNNGTDQNIANDVLYYNFFSVESPTEVELELKTDDFGNETSWELRNAVGTLIERGGSYPGVTGGQVYKRQFCLYDGCYRFVIYDTFGDGFCCSNGQGYYLLRDVASGDTIEFNDTFSTNSDTASFCVGDSCTILVDAHIKPVSEVTASDGGITLDMVAGNPPFSYDWNTGAKSKDLEDLAIGTYNVTITDSLDCTATFTFEVKLTTGISSTLPDVFRGIKIYPNPGDGLLNVAFSPAMTGMTEFTVYDMIGKAVYQKRMSASTGIGQLDLRELKKGVYFIRLTYEDQQVVSKIIIN